MEHVFLWTRTRDDFENNSIECVDRPDSSRMCPMLLERGDDLSSLHNDELIAEKSIGNAIDFSAAATGQEDGGFFLLPGGWVLETTRS